MVSMYFFALSSLLLHIFVFFLALVILREFHKLVFVIFSPLIYCSGPL